MTEMADILLSLHEMIMGSATAWAQKKAEDRWENGRASAFITSWYTVALKFDRDMAEEGRREYRAMMWGGE